VPTAPSGGVVGGVEKAVPLRRIRAWQPIRKKNFFLKLLFPALNKVAENVVVINRYLSLERVKKIKFLRKNV